MIDVRPAILEGGGIRLEPLTDNHHQALAAATVDGRLSELWFTAVPGPEGMQAYVADALKGQRDGHRACGAMEQRVIR
jgi:N-acetyltransferase